jgi:hypothetical protein
VARQRTSARWRRIVGMLMAAAAATSAGLVASESPAAAIPTATLSCQNPQTNTVHCHVTIGNLGRPWSIVWTVNGADDIEFDNEEFWFDGCLPGDPYSVTVTVFDRTGSDSDSEFFNCQGNG